MKFLAPMLALGVALLLGSLPCARTQEKKSEPAAAPDEKAELAEFLDDARHYAIRATKPEAALKLHEPPVLNFTNPERNQERGSVFVWLDGERPAVVGQFFRYDTRSGTRPKKHALHSLMPGPLEAKFNERIAWTPEQAGVEWKEVPNAPAVAATKKQRFFQMRELSKSFKANLIDPRATEKPIELRRLDRPLFEYSAPKQGVTDAAFFSFVVATDPEAILLLEAFDEKGKTGYRFAFARFHFWRLTATLDGKLVWDVEFDASMLNNPIGATETMKKSYNSFVP